MLKRLSQGWQIQNSVCSYACLETLALLFGPRMLRWQEVGVSTSVYSNGAGLLLNERSKLVFQDTAFLPHFPRLFLCTSFS